MIELPIQSVSQLDAQSIGQKARQLTNQLTVQ